MSSSLRSSIRRALFTAGLVASVSAVAEPQSTSDTSEITEIIIVTGSYIRGTAEDAALPVDVFTADDLAAQGSPSMIDLVKSIPAVQGVVGESNQFGSAQSTGSGNINLRGLGGVRTLVLMNGRRIAASPTGNGVDTNLLPMAAIGRIEVLKDGAAATYGSDAIGGVVNFITKTGFDGLSLDGSYSYIDGSDGDYNANVVWGHQGEGWDMMLAAGYRHRSELSTTERDWAVRPITENPQGGWSSFGSPGTYSLAGAPAFRDPGCVALGGLATTSATGTQQCQFQYITFDNLVEDEEHYQVYAEFNKDFGDSVSWHLEAMYGVHDAKRENSSPSYAPNQGPAPGPGGAISSPTYVIPINNPGLQALLPFLDPTTRANVLARTSVFASGLQWRPLGNGGNPLTGEGKEDERLFDGFRVSTGLTGELGPVNWDLGLTYSENTREANTPDILAYRLQRALSGLGGPSCTGTTAGANGCEWLNPFSTGFAFNPSTGAQNDATYVANIANTNSNELFNWLFEDLGYKDTGTLFAADLVFNGEMGIALPGGNIGWAFGSQYREEGFQRETNDFTNIELNPCVDTPVNGNTSCTTQSGVFTFFGPLREQDLTRDVVGVFGELSLPLFDSLQAQLAVRYEDYGGNVGATTNPKLSLRWQALDWLAFRGSYGTTFRGPLQNQLLDGFVTTLAFTSRVSGYKPYDNYGNPDLKPEEADTFNVGFMVNAGGFTATADYWNVTFTDPIGGEGGTDLVEAFFGTATAPIDQCNNAAYDALQTRMTFATGTCSAANLIRTRVNTINGPEERVEGIDASIAFRFADMFTVGTDASYTLSYERDALIVEGVQIKPEDDYAGTRGSTVGSIPQLRGSAYFDVGLEHHNFRLTSRYIDGVEDTRSSVPVGTPGHDVDSFLTFDLVYRLLLPAQTTVTAAVFNIADEDPPFARLDLSYEPFIGNPLGRYYKIGLEKKF
ncbi:iron complex outermembrane receptor protein [Povalibacter uvarum]|uniref:Iron complex outermembrane receptor protein n=1 Tax=Povalibacter uvarum TaxID=732238 RepID=A0A841HKB3_9GAMM|nr:TonB-dependent receptor [Povalibacter uvarum]MBB6092740.1 iron complex outermembrane receptor protein [Povalibacter uvarum]